MAEPQVEVRCPACGARYWVEPAQLEAVAECSQCGREFALAPLRSGLTAPAEVTVALEESIERSNLTISSFLREQGISGGITLEESDSSAMTDGLLETETGRKYAVGRVVARGGMGAILNCRDLNVRRNVAMKVMLKPERTGPPRILRFIEEAQVTGQLEHPGVVPVYELGVDASKNVFYTMKFVRGRDLKDILKALAERDAATVTAFPLSRLLTVFLRVCEAVAYAHHKRVIHRDLKPENIMVGDFGEVYVMDWGLAKVLDRDGGGGSRGEGTAGRSETQTPSSSAIHEIRGDFDTRSVKTLDGAILGSPHYMAPEQARGRAAALDGRADIYALGGILYEILSLRRAVDGETAVAVLLKVAMGELKPLPTTADPAARPHCPGGVIPPALAAVAMKALAVKPEDRYQTVAELQADIEAYQNGFATSAEHAGLGRLLLLFLKRHRTFAVSALAIVLALAVGLTATSIQWRRAAAAEVKATQHQHFTEIALGQAEKARDAERRLKEAAEYDAYAATIGAVGSYVENGEFPTAEELLNRCPPRFRHWEWGYLKALCHEERLLVPVEGGSWAVAYAPDGKSALCGDSAGRVLQVDRASGQVIRTFSFGSKNEVRGVAMAPGGDRMAAAGYGGIIKVWDFASGAEVLSLKDNGTQTLGVLFSPDGSTIAAWNVGRKVTAWDARTGNAKFTVAVEKSMLSWNALAFLDGGKILACACPHTCTVLLLDAETGQTTRTLALTQVPYCLASAADGRRLLVGCLSATELWDAEAGKSLRTFAHPTAQATACAFSPDSKQALVLGNEDRTVRVYVVETGELVRTFRGHRGLAAALDVSPDGNELVTGSLDGTVRFWDQASAGPCRRVGWAGVPSGWVRRAFFLNDGSSLLTINEANGVAALDLETGRGLGPTTRVPGGSDWNWLESSADGRLLVYPDAKRPGDVDVWSIPEGRLITTFSRHTFAGRVRFLPDNRRVLSGGADKTIRLWDANTGQEVWGRELRSATDPLFLNVSGLAVSPCGKQFLAIAESRAELGEVETGAVRLNLQCGLGHYGAAFSLDGKRFLAGDTVFALATGERLFALQGVATIHSACFSPDGLRLATGGLDRTVRVWDAATGRLLLTLREHQRLVSKVEFSRDGRYLLSCGIDCAVYLRRAADWREPAKDAPPAR